MCPIELIIKSRNMSCSVLKASMYGIQGSSHLSNLPCFIWRPVVVVLKPSWPPMAIGHEVSWSVWPMQFLPQSSDQIRLVRRVVQFEDFGRNQIGHYGWCLCSNNLWRGVSKQVLHGSTPMIALVSFRSIETNPERIQQLVSVEVTTAYVSYCSCCSFKLSKPAGTSTPIHQWVPRIRPHPARQHNEPGWHHFETAHFVKCSRIKLFALVYCFLFSPNWFYSVFIRVWSTDMFGGLHLSHMSRRHVLLASLVCLAWLSHRLAFTLCGAPDRDSQILRRATSDSGLLWFGDLKLNGNPRKIEERHSGYKNSIHPNQHPRSETI